MQSLVSKIAQLTRLVKTVAQLRVSPQTALTLSLLYATAVTSGCSMQEEIRRIEEVKKQRLETVAGRSTNLTGAQIYVRSCNECHAKGKKGPLAPSLINMDKDFPADDTLRSFLRRGKGNMPGNSPAQLNEQELTNLIYYLRQLNNDMRETEKNQQL